MEYIYKEKNSVQMLPLAVKLLRLPHRQANAKPGEVQLSSSFMINININIISKKITAKKSYNLDI